MTAVVGLLPDRNSFVRRAVVLGLLFASGLGATGHFRAAVALTLGAAVAIVGALWLSDLVGRFGALQAPAGPGFNWKFAATGLLRYGFAGLILWGAVKTFPEEIPWLLLGTSVAVLAALWQAVMER